MKTVTIEINKEFFDRIVRLANSYKELLDDFDPRDHSGGNFDDAFFMGQTHGEELFAYELIDAMPEG
jgi:hypothetical protein